jgi:type IV pilus assembly protein PilQ
MKRARQWTRLVFLLVTVTAVLPPEWSAPFAGSDAFAQTVSAGYLENVTFEKLPGKERVTLTVSKQSGVTVESQPGNAVLVRLENLFVPEGLRRSLDDPSLTTVMKVTPVQKTAEGRAWVLTTIDLKQKVPYSVRQEGMNVLIDFNVTSVASAAETMATKPAADKAAAPLKVDTLKEPSGDAGNGTMASTGPRVSLDVQDADINKVVFRLLSELGNVSIVSGDDVKGNVTLKLDNVPWEQALDTVLGISGLGKKRVGNVITVTSMEKIKKEEADRAALEKMKKDEADRIASEKRRLEQAEQIREPLITRVVPIAYNEPDELKKNVEEILKGKETKEAKDPKQPADSKASVNWGSVTIDKHTRSLIIQATRQDMDTVLRFIEKIDKPTPQILIKANIVETTKSTARNLGVMLGGMWGQKIGNQGLYVTPGGTGGSAVAPGSAFNGSYTPTSGTSGISGQGFGVNFPALMTGGTASLGLMFGTIGENILELQLNALQKDGKLNILSSPSITTLDNQMAFTENGDIVPYATTETSGGVVTRSIKKEDATLRLEIVPHVIDGKNLKMKIVVKKNEVDQSRNVDGNPYVLKKQTETSLIVQDGETIVISGLTKQTKQENVTGVPWLKDIPVLGWVFKGESKSDLMEEVLIFLTSTIIRPQELAGIQTGP